MVQHTRRRFLLAVGSTAAASAGAMGSVSTGKTKPSNDWRSVESPTSKTLYGVVDTAEGQFAVGGGGDVIARRGDGWQKVVEYGPQARSRRLTGVDVTDDGARIWFVGGSGVIGEYDVVTRTLTNYSAPKGKTSTWEDVAVKGTAGENERLYFVNGSGELLVGVRQNSGAMKYEEVIKPGGGSTIPAIDFHGRKSGHVCSTSQFVAKTTNGGGKWTRVGIDFAGEGFFDIASVGMKDVNVAAGNGIVYRYDGFRWTPHVIDDDRQAVRAVDRDGGEGLAAGDGGKVYSRLSAGQWRRHATPAEAQLRGVSRGSAGVDVAVGNGGAIVERTVDRGDTGGTTNTTSASSATVPLSDASKAVERYAQGEWV